MTKGISMTKSAVTAAEIEVVNPSDGSVVGSIREDSALEVGVAVQEAHAAQSNWKRTSRRERYDIVERYVSKLREHHEQLACSLAAESGKPLQQTRDEISAATHVTHGYAERLIAEESRAYYLDTDAGAEDDLMVVRDEPLGVVAAISAFNYPAEIGTHKMIPALLTGNAVVIKPPEKDPLTLQRMIALLHESGMPESLLHVVHGGRAVGEALVSHPLVSAVSLTGSEAAGQSVAVTAAKTLKRVLLELGGNDAFIVLPDADLDHAVDEAIIGRITANGQVCIANKRLIVHRDVAASFTERLTARVEELVMGPAMNEDTDLGPLIDAASAELVADQVADAVSSGARVAAGGGRPDGAYFNATVLTNVTHSMPIARDLEVFGPVFPIIEVDSASEAVRVANSSRYGLSGAVFTADLPLASRIANDLESGMVVVNGTGCYRVDATPFGGFKFSGTTREGLTSSLDEYRQKKSIVFRGMAGFKDRY